MTRLMAKNGDTADLQTVQERIAVVEARLSALPGEIAAAKRMNIDEYDLTTALEAFGPVWDALWPTERARILSLLIGGIEYFGGERRAEIRLRPHGFPAEPAR